MKWMLVFMVLAIIWNNSALAYDFCKKDRPIAHVPRADVVHGNNQIAIREIIYIPVTIDMAERYGLSVPAGIELESTLGMIEIYKDGKILYDGKDISGNLEDECNNDTSSEFETIIERQTKNGNQPNQR